MVNQTNIMHLAKETISMQAESIQRMASKLDENFTKSVETIFHSKGRLVVTGIGKSALIGQKMVATFNSTGTPSIFMHAADAIHGDLGIIQKEDVVIAISKSGETPEIKALVPFLKQKNGILIAITGNAHAYLAQKSDYVLDTWVEKEACTNNMAPTTSTTAQLVMGDALAVCLQELRGFKKEDFAQYHPGGSLGKRMYLKVADLLRKDAKPLVYVDSSVKDVISEISAKRVGATVVLDRNDKLVGIVTDGDIRRMLEQHDNIAHIRAEAIMTKSPKTIEQNDLAIEALTMMRAESITQTVVFHKTEYAGLIHLHDILNEGIE